MGHINTDRSAGRSWWGYRRWRRMMSYAADTLDWLISKACFRVLCFKLSPYICQYLYKYIYTIIYFMPYWGCVGVAPLFAIRMSCLPVFKALKLFVGFCASLFLLFVFFCCLQRSAKTIYYLIDDWLPRFLQNSSSSNRRCAGVYIFFFFVFLVCIEETQKVRQENTLLRWIYLEVWVPSML